MKRFLLLPLLVIIIIFNNNLVAQNGGYAVMFDGVNGKAVANMNTGNTNSTMTMEFWFARVSDQGGLKYLADLHSISGLNRRRVMPYISNGQIGIEAYPNTGDDDNFIIMNTGFVPPLNIWTHIAVVINGMSLKMYINGKEYVNSSFITSPYQLTGNEDLSIATDYLGTTFANIKVDEMRIWSIDRSQAQINANMYKELVGNEAGLLSYYKMSDGAGVSISSNQSVGAYNAALNGGNTWITSGAFLGTRDALYFDGQDDYVNCGNGAQVQFNGAQNFTVEAWVKPTAAQWGAIVSKFQHSAAHEGYSLEMFSDLRVSLLFGNNWSDWQAVTSTNPLTLNTWNHVAATYDGSTVKIYINGRLDGTYPYTNGFTDPGTPLVIGSRMGNTIFSTFFKGYIDEARVWATALTEAQLRENMCKTLVGNEAGLRAYYRIDETAGSTTYDYTSYAANGTLTDMDVVNDWTASDAFNTWTGAEDAGWINPGNWSKGVPTSDQSVGIYKWALGNEATISSTPTIRNLVISSTSSPQLNSDITINGNLCLEKNFDLNGRNITLSSTSYLLEGTGKLYGTAGTISITKSLSSPNSINVGGLGLLISSASNLGSTTITRGHAVQTGNGNSSIRRYYDITPTNNSSVNGTIVFPYLDTELNALTENTLIMFKSTDAGTAWTDQGGTLNAGANTVTKTGISSFSRWTLGSSAATLSAIPLAPTANAATSISATGFSANWDASVGATKYYLDVATNNTFTSMVAGYNNLDVGNVTTYSVTGLSGGTTYYYRVRANNASGTSGNSGTITVLTLPAAPVATSASSITTTSFTANWNASTGATKYYLDVATDNAFTSMVAGYNNLDVSNVTSYSVTGLTSGTTYYYRVRGYNASGASGNSNTITTSAIPLAPLANAASSIASTSFSANWNTSTGATKYYLDVATDNAFTSMAAGYNNLDVGNVTTYSVTGLNAGTTYYYRVRANNVSGASGNSGTITVLTLPAAPVAASASSITTTSFTANWNASTGATKYYVDVSTDADFINMVTRYHNKDAGNAISISVNGLSAGTTYYYRVRGYNASGSSANSNVVEAAIIPLEVVATAATEVTQAGFTANWNTVTGAAGYQVDVATDITFTNFVTGFNNKAAGNETTLKVPGLQAGTTYYYRVRSYNNGGVSGNSNIITAATIPATPVATAATNLTNNSFSANWNAVAGATGYLVDVATDVNFMNLVFGYNNKTVGNVTTTTINGELKSSTNYYYRIRAYNAGGTSESSNIITVVTATTAPVLSGIEETELEYTEGAGAKQITNTISVSDEDDTNLAGAIVKVTGNYKSVEDRLVYENREGITGSWDAARGELALTGTASLANYQSALRSISYQNNSENPGTLVRTVSFSVSDGEASSNVASRNISITATNNAPVITGIEGDTLVYTEGQDNFIIASGIIISDVDNETLDSAKIKIADNYLPGEDILKFTNQNGIVGSWNATDGTLTLRGTAAINLYKYALHGITYKNTSANPSNKVRTISIVVNDGSRNSNLVRRYIKVEGVNTAPVISGIETDTLKYKKGDSATVISHTIKVEDADGLINGGIVKIYEGFIKGEDKLEFTLAGSITESYNAENGTLTLTGEGTPAEYESVLRSVKYENIKGTSATTSCKKISYIVTDGIANSNEAVRSIEIKSLLMPPTNLTSRITEQGYVILEWKDNSDNEDGYVIERSVTDSLSFKTLRSLGANVCSYVDSAISNGVKYYYRVYTIKGTAVSAYSNIVEVTGTTTDVFDEMCGIPTEYAIYQNYPNPFNPATRIRYQVPVSSDVCIKIYDILGTEVITLVDEEKHAGYYTVNWNAANSPSGIYFYTIRAGSFTSVKKMILIK